MDLGIFQALWDTLKPFVAGLFGFVVILMIARSAFQGFASYNGSEAGGDIFNTSEEDVVFGDGGGMAEAKTYFKHVVELIVLGVIGLIVIFMGDVIFKSIADNAIGLFGTDNNDYRVFGQFAGLATFVVGVLQTILVLALLVIITKNVFKYITSSRTEDFQGAKNALQHIVVAFLIGTVAWVMLTKGVPIVTNISDAIQDLLQQGINSAG